MKGVVRLGAIALTMLMAVAMSCTDPYEATPSEAREGEEGGICFRNNTCLTELTCLSGRCVRVPSPPRDSDGGGAVPEASAPEASSDGDSAIDPPIGEEAGPPLPLFDCGSPPPPSSDRPCGAGACSGTAVCCLADGGECISNANTCGGDFYRCRSNDDCPTFEKCCAKLDVDGDPCVRHVRFSQCRVSCSQNEVLLCSKAGQCPRNRCDSITLAVGAHTVASGLCR